MQLVMTALQSKFAELFPVTIHATQCARNFDAQQLSVHSHFCMWNWMTDNVVFTLPLEPIIQSNETIAPCQQNQKEQWGKHLNIGNLSAKTFEWASNGRNKANAWPEEDERLPETSPTSRQWQQQWWINRKVSNTQGKKKCHACKIVSNDLPFVLAMGQYATCFWVLFCNHFNKSHLLCKKCCWCPLESN